MTPAAVIETRRLTKSYGRARGIVDVDLRVEAGEVFGFLGPNGAGKTTLIRTLLDFLRPTSGSATVMGLDSHANSMQIRRQTAYLAGDLGLYENLTAREHLAWLARLAGGVDWDKIEELATRFQLDLDRPIRALSKGNRQKVGIVQAFMLEAPLMILDEPTAGLDPLMQHEFQQLARERISEGATVFLSSHLLDEVQQITDRVGIIREGRLVAIENVEDMRAKSVRHVEVRFMEKPDVDALEAVAGVRDVVSENRTVRLTLDGPMDPLIKTLANQGVEDLVSEPLDLEDVFLQLYGDGDGH